MIQAIVILTIFSVGLAYLAFPRFLTYRKMKAAAVNVYYFFQKRA